MKFREIYKSSKYFGYLGRQNHVHLVNPDTGKKEPLAACRSKENPNLCKSNFPRNKWLVRDPVVLCAGLLKQMGLHTRGRKCQLGGLHGPMNHESLNATHSAMLAALRCNSDVQLPYRLPIIESTHCCHGKPRPTCGSRANEIFSIFHRKKENFGQTKPAQHKRP